MLQGITFAAFLLFACFVSVSYTSKEDVSDVKISFKHMAGNKALVFDSVNYTNQTGQRYTISKLMYYISHLTLASQDGYVYENKNGYYLIDASNDSTCVIILKNIPKKNYQTLLFTIGVDSLKSSEETIQEGALDPMNGMFWTWNTGYIFFKLEGKSSASTQTNHTIEYHIGGYKKPANCIRQVKLNVNNINIFDINIQVNASAFLQALDIAALPTVTTHRHAEEMADRYATLFSIAK